MESLFPVWDDPSTWNLNALSSICDALSSSVGDFELANPRDIVAGWLQDDWHVTDQMTLNLGIRYDLDLGGIGENVELLPWIPRRGAARIPTTWRRVLASPTA